MKVLLTIALLVSPCLGRVAPPVPIFPYIVGGQEVFPAGSYPWQGALENVPAFGQPSFNCGCVLLTDSIILTAAHCLGTNVERYRFLLGAHDRNTQIQGFPTYVTAEEIVLHPDWDNTPANGFPNDIAVVKINGSIPESIYIQPIGMPSSDRDWSDGDCLISGWGRTSGEGSLPNILRYAEIPVITNSDCSARWSPYPVGPGHVCVINEEANDKGACNGDSGGPLVCRDSADSDYELVGLTSWGATGCLTEYPSVYTRVFTYLDWIEEVIDSQGW